MDSALSKRCEVATTQIRLSPHFPAFLSSLHGNASLLPASYVKQFGQLTISDLTPVRTPYRITVAAPVLGQTDQAAAVRANAVNRADIKLLPVEQNAASSSRNSARHANLLLPCLIPPVARWAFPRSASASDGDSPGLQLRPKIPDGLPFHQLARLIEVIANLHVRIDPQGIVHRGQ